LKTN
jgi:hypothetical protein